jgi:hypothetical protein
LLVKGKRRRKNKIKGEEDIAAYLVSFLNFDRSSEE